MGVFIGSLLLNKIKLLDYIKKYFSIKDKELR